MTQLVLQGLQQRSHKTFANFYPGQNHNIVAYLQNELLTQKGCVYLWGSADCGRTHLLQAVGELALCQQQTSMYLSLKEANLYTPEILTNLERVAVLCVDDIDAVLGQPLWEQALFNAYNHTRENNGVWLCSAKTSVRGLACLLPDLQSRLSWGQVFHLESLTETEKIAALQLHANERGMIVSDEVLHFLLNHYPRDLSALLSLLEKLDSASLTEKKRLTIPFVREILKVAML